MPLRAAFDGAVLRGSGTSWLLSLRTQVLPDPAEATDRAETHVLLGG